MASLGNMYPNLPGQLVEYKDGGKALRFDQTELNTDSMLILGTAVDGPIMEPVAVDENTVELLFGSELKENGAPNGSTLVKAFNEAYDGGCRDIRLMRVTGSEASVVVSAASEDIESIVRIDEAIGYTKGNKETVLNLVRTGIMPESVEVTAKGRRVDKRFVTVNPDSAQSTVTLAENACDAGSIITVEYDYEREEAVVDTNLVESDARELFLSKTPIVSSVVVKNSSNTVVDPATYTVEGNKVTFAPGEGVAVKDIELNSSKETLVVPKGRAKAKTKAAGDVYTVEYNVLVTGRDLETVDTDGNNFVAIAEDQVLQLSGKPRSEEEVSLYIDNTLVLDTNAFKVNLVNNTIVLKPQYFTMGEEVSISYFAVKVETVKKEIKISSVFGGEVYNQAKVEVMDIRDNNGEIITRGLRITKPQSKLASGEQPLLFNLKDFATFGELVEAINTYGAIFKAETMTPDELTSGLANMESYLRGGDNGVNVSTEDMFVALSGKRDRNGFLEKQGAYQLLENYQCDWVTPVGVYADDKLLDRNKDFAYELALFCAVNSVRNKSMYGTIAMKPLKNTSLASVQAHAKYLANFKNQYFMKDSKGSVIVDGQKNVIDLGKYITLVAGPTVTVNHQVLSLKDTDGAVLYASYNTVLLPQSAPTNKKLPGTLGVKYNFSNAQLNDIVGNRMVCFGKKFSARGGAVQGAFVIDGPTCARPGSEYGRLSTLKVMRETADQVREVADPFIGEANTIEQRNALSAALAKRLDTLVSNGVLMSYTMNIVSTAKQQVLGEASLELGIVAPQELRKITTVMGLKR